MGKQSSNPLLASSMNGSCLYEGTTGPLCISTDAERCQSRYKGVFVEGLTCGPVSGLSGSCCLWDPENRTILPCQTSTFSACQALAESFNFKFNWSTVSCSERKCEYVFESKASRQPILGACCNGNGLCKETTKEDCENSQFFYQGNGTICNKGICIEGTGGCCNGVTCNDGITGTYCVENKSLYLGKGKRCWEFTCETDRLPCLDSIPTEKLKIGDLFEDGVIVGIYQPGRSLCWGNSAFSSRINLNLITNPDPQSATYTPLVDGRGYGFIHSELCSIEDSYIMIMSMESLSNNITKSRYTWSTGGKSWGPLFDRFGRIIEPDTIGLALRNEGYVYNSGLTDNTNNSIINQNATFYCKKRSPADTPITRLTTRSEHGAWGRWSTDWGLYNTIRLVNAKLFNDVGISYDAYLYPSLYDKEEKFNTISMKTMSEAIIELNRNSSRNYSATSDWFIPAANEWSFIAHEILHNRLNENLIAVGAEPLSDIHWTSTGAHNYKTGEGISDGITASIGTVAWSVNFNNLNFSLRDRLETAKVRPIRLHRCDGRYLSSTKYSAIWEVNR